MYLFHIEYVTRAYVQRGVCSQICREGRNHNNEISKLAPWNWFKKEEEQEAVHLPVQRQAQPDRHAHPMLQLHREIDRLFGSAFRGFGLPSMGLGKDLSALAQSDWLKPTLDVAATDKDYTISVELPGVDPKDVQLEVVNDTMKIKGEKKQEKKENDKDFYCIERSYGSFQRVLSLPEDADQNAISAVYKHGVMRITIPRRTVPQAESKQIEIEAG